MRTRAIAAAALVALAGAYASAGTTSVKFSSDISQHHLGSFAGTATYDSSAGKLTLVLQNTTPMATGGYLTAFAFDVAGDSSAAYADPDGGHKPNTNGFDDIRNKRGFVTASPFGKYEAGAGLDGKWMPGGAQRGIAAGGMQTFVFDLTGAGASSLNASDFFSGGQTGLNLVASFKRMKHGRIDRAGGILTGTMSSLDALTSTTDDNSGGNNPPISPPSGGNTLPIVSTGDGNGNRPTAVPVPAAAWTGLTTLAMIGAGAIRRRTRR